MALPTIKFAKVTKLTGVKYNSAKLKMLKTLQSTPLPKWDVSPLVIGFSGSFYTTDYAGTSLQALACKGGMMPNKLSKSKIFDPDKLGYQTPYDEGQALLLYQVGELLKAMLNPADFKPSFVPFMQWPEKFDQQIPSFATAGISNFVDTSGSDSKSNAKIEVQTETSGGSRARLPSMEAMLGRIHDLSPNITINPKDFSGSLGVFMELPNLTDSIGLRTVVRVFDEFMPAFRADETCGSYIPDLESKIHGKLLLSLDGDLLIEKFLELVSGQYSTSLSGPQLKKLKTDLQKQIMFILSISKPEDAISGGVDHVIEKYELFAGSLFKLKQFYDLAKIHEIIIKLAGKINVLYALKTIDTVMKEIGGAEQGKSAEGILKSLADQRYSLSKGNLKSLIKNGKSDDAITFFIQTFFVFLDSGYMELAKSISNAFSGLATQYVEFEDAILIFQEVASSLNKHPLKNKKGRDVLYGVADEMVKMANKIEEKLTGKKGK